MRNEMEYNGYAITYSCGYYWIEGSKQPYTSWNEVKTVIDFWLDELAMND